MSAPRRGPMIYAGTKLAVIIMVARGAATGVAARLGVLPVELNWTVLLSLASHQVNKYEAEYRARFLE